MLFPKKTPRSSGHDANVNQSKQEIKTFIKIFSSVVFLQMLICLFSYTKSWTNKKLSHWLAHRVSLPVSWELLGQLCINGKHFLMGGFIN
jgi:hypothetical protein